jgi:phospholipid transport system substrate-binding protein
MSFSRRSLLVLPLAIAAAPRAARAVAAGGEAVSVIQRFYAQLLAEMQRAKHLTFDQRYAILAPAIGQTFDLALMTRIAVGPAWAQLPPEQQRRIFAAFTRYTVANYASRFDDYGGERFEVSPTTTANVNGVIVASKLIKSNGEPVTLNYLMRQEGTGWKVIDVYLSGTVSELAARRSEFVAVLQRSGPDGLVRLIEQKSAALRAG